jgi:hypothetical protein
MALKQVGSGETTLPWGTPSEMVDERGVNAALFGFAGSGKTTVAVSAVSAASGLPLLVVNLDPELDSIRDRTDIQVWPKKGGVKNWERIQAFTDRLATGKHPFNTIVFDTGNNMYRYALQHIKSTGNPNRDPRQIFGAANELVNEVIVKFVQIANEKGTNVIWNWHAEEVREVVGDGVKITIRPDATPGVLKTIYQQHSTIGYLEVRQSDKRRLYLHNSLKVIAKVHQPQGEGALSTEIDDPDFGKVIDHLRGVAKYDAGKKSSLRSRSA